MIEKKFFLHLFRMWKLMWMNKWKNVMMDCEYLNYWQEKGTKRGRRVWRFMKITFIWKIFTHFFLMLTVNKKIIRLLFILASEINKKKCLPFFVLSMHESTCVLNKFKCKFSSPHIYTQITSYTTLLFQFVIPPVTAGLYYCISTSWPPHSPCISLFLFLIINKYTQIKFTHSLPRSVWIKRLKSDS